MSSETTKSTLYERLGGVYSIAAVVDDFIDRVMHNPVLFDEAHHRVSAAGFKYYVTEMVCWATVARAGRQRGSTRDQMTRVRASNATQQPRRPASWA